MNAAPLWSEIVRLSGELDRRARRVGLTKQEIARRAGVSRRTVYRFFGADGQWCHRSTVARIEQAVTEAERETLEQLQGGGEAA